MSNSARISASSHLCCEGMNTANIGCHWASSNSEYVDGVHASILDLRVLEPDTDTVDLGCGHRQEIPFAGSSQHHEYAEVASSPLGSDMQDASMVSPVGMNHQMNNVTSPGAQLGLSVERGDELKGLQRSSVVTKNTFGGNAIIEVDNSRRWLMLLSYIGDPFGSKRSQVSSMGASDAN